jgi:hypothetical protein
MDGEKPKKRNYRSSEEKAAFPLRLPKSHMAEYQGLAAVARKSLNQYLEDCLYQYHHPLASAPQISSELVMIETKLDDLNSKQEAFAKANASIRDQAAVLATSIPNHATLQERVLKLLHASNVPLTELTIAYETGEEGETILAICSLLEKRKKIKLTWDQKWQENRS